MEMKVNVTQDTARLLRRGMLVDVSTGEVHQSSQSVLGRKVRMVRGNYVRIHRSVACEPETAYAVEFLDKYPDGRIPRGQSRTWRWRLRRMEGKGYAVHLGDGTFLLDPGKWSIAGYDEELLPNQFR